MIEQDGFLGIRFGEPLQAAHQKLSLHGFQFVKRENALPPLGRVLYKGLYEGFESQIHLEFLRNEFHRSRVEIQTNDSGKVQNLHEELSRKFGASERLTRSRQACTDDSPQDPCFNMWAIDDDTSIILDVAGNHEKPVIVLEIFRIF